jgi:chitinase
MKTGAMCAAATFALGLYLSQPALAQPSLSVADVSVFEGNAGTTSLAFVVARSSTGVRSTVSYAVTGGSALPGSDFVSVPSGTLVFSGSDSSLSVKVTVNGDVVAEANETLKLTLSAPGGATVADGEATGTILNDDLATISVADVSVLEGQAGTTPLTFLVKRDAGVPESSSVTVATTNGSALAGSDYQAIGPQVVSFGNGETSKSVVVNVIGDTTGEGDETFRLQLSAPVRAILGTASATGTVNNDDFAFLSIADARIPEGDEGSTALNFIVTRSGDMNGTVSARYATQAGTAAERTDYQGVERETITFGPQQANAAITINVVGEVLPEADEKFKVKLSDPVGASISDGEGQGTIENDDLPTVEIGNAVKVEGNSGTSTLTFTVTRTGGGGEISVHYFTQSDTASGGSDYVTVSSTPLVFGPNDRTKTVDVIINGDVVVEAEERFKVRLANQDRCVIIDDEAIGRIQNDDSSVSVGNFSFVEGTTVGIGGPFELRFVVTRTGAFDVPASVVYATTGGTATPGVDYIAQGPATLDFGNGESSRTVIVPVIVDATQEPDETVILTLSNPVGVSIADGTGEATILNDDNPPQPATLSINDVSVPEGGGPAVFTVTRSGDLSGTATVSCVQGQGGSAAPPGGGLGSTDYSPPNNPLTFNPGVATRTLNVTVNQDESVENDETFFVELTGASGATISDAIGQGTIVDDDEYGLKVSDANVTEGNSGTKVMTFSVLRIPPGPRGGSAVTYTVVGGTATAGTDFIAPPPTFLVFNTNQFTKSISITINGDTEGEGDETFQINLSGPEQAVITDGSGTGTILNDDSSLSISDASIAEGPKDSTRNLVFTVVRNGSSNGAASVNWATSNVTAQVGTDYVGVPSTPLSFASGETSRTVTVTILGDDTPEPNETFHVTLSGATGAVISNGTAVGTITNDD